MRKDQHSYLNTFAIIIILSMTITNSSAQLSISEIRGAAPVVPLKNEPPAKLYVDQPLAGPLSLGRVVIQYRADNIHFVPVYGPVALEVSPRVGHVHVTVDNATWHWADASGEPLILNGFSPGKHSVLVELADPTHKIIDRKTITFDVPNVEHSNVH